MISKNITFGMSYYTYQKMHNQLADETFRPTLPILHHRMKRKHASDFSSKQLSMKIRTCSNTDIITEPSAYTKK